MAAEEVAGLVAEEEPSAGSAVGSAEAGLVAVLAGRSEGVVAGEGMAGVEGLVVVEAVEAVGSVGTEEVVVDSAAEMGLAAAERRYT